MRGKITDAYIRTYSDTNQTMAYVEWEDSEWTGRTEGSPNNLHIQELFRAAEREGINVRKEVW